MSRCWPERSSSASSGSSRTTASAQSRRYGPRSGTAPSSPRQVSVAVRPRGRAMARTVPRTCRVEALPNIGRRAGRPLPARCQPADIGVIRSVRPVTPPCRHDSGQPGVPAFPGCPTRVRPVRAPLPPRAGALADGIQAAQCQNAPPIYLRRSSLPSRHPLLGSRCDLAGVRTTLEPDAGRTETDIHLGQGVLNPC
jgi:hypothetical protein